MLMDPHGHKPILFQREIPIGISLAVVGGIILASIIASVIAARRKKPPGNTAKDQKD
jgi:hypothetical protein